VGSEREVRELDRRGGDRVSAALGCVRPVATARGEEQDGEETSDVHGSGAYRPVRNERLGYHRGMAHAAQIEPSRPLTPSAVSAGEAVRMAVRTTAVDAVGLEERAASLAKRSIKKDAKLWALDLAIRSMDLTTLEGSDTVGKIVAICAKAVRPDPLNPSIPPVAAVCLYPQLVPVALEQLEGTGVKVASVAGGFPSGLGPLDARLQEIRDVAATGAHEIDIVLNRSLFLGGRYAKAFEELVAAREAAGAAHLKVILETGELGSYDRVRQASMLAMAAGADFIKTSTGKIGTNATLPVALCMLEAARDFHRETGRPIGIKVAGGVRAAKQAIQYLVLVHETLGADWMTPDRFRIGASSLLNDVLMQIEKERTGRYAGPDYFTID
jgi:deoxyribose-phosphate aldolase